MLSNKAYCIFRLLSFWRWNKQTWRSAKCLSRSRNFLPESSGCPGIQLAEPDFALHYVIQSIDLRRPVTSAWWKVGWEHKPRRRASRRGRIQTTLDVHSQKQRFRTKRLRLVSRQIVGKNQICREVLKSADLSRSTLLPMTVSEISAETECIRAAANFRR